MCGEASGVACTERVEDQSREHEVVGPEAVGRQPFVGRVDVVDLGQDNEPE